MVRLDERFETLEQLQARLDYLVETNRIYNYEVRPTFDEYGYDVYITPVPTLERIEITVVGSQYRDFTVG